MPDTDAIEGRCLCGSVMITVKAAHDPRPGICHCRMCQRWSGGVFMSFDAQAEGVSVTGEVRSYRSSSFAERAFCPVCGSHLWMRDLNGDSYDLMPGLFDAASTWPLQSEIYTDQALAAVRLSGGHLRKTAAEYEATNPFVERDPS
ncbi:MAG: GFA family protein [Paracoccaceae bacterium]